MVEVIERGLVAVADVDHEGGGIGQVGFRGLAAKDRGGTEGEEESAGDELVFVRGAGVGDNRGKGRHWVDRPTVMGRPNLAA